MSSAPPNAVLPAKPVGNDPDDLAPTRWSLIGRLKNLDDQESWREFFETYWRLINNVALKAGLNHIEAEEVVQETVMSVCRNMSGFEASPRAGSFKSWLLGVTRWRMTDQFRLRKRLGTVPPPDRGSERLEDNKAEGAGRVIDPPEAIEQWEALWNAEWDNHVLDAALEKLKKEVAPRQFQVFFLHVIKQEPVMEVVRSLRVNPGAVYLVKHRVTKVFKKIVKEVEEGLSKLPVDPAKRG